MLRRRFRFLQRIAASVAQLSDERLVDAVLPQIVVGHRRKRFAVYALTVPAEQQRVGNFQQPHDRQQLCGRVATDVAVRRYS